jgi:hypothetical protein
LTPWYNGNIKEVSMKLWKIWQEENRDHDNECYGRGCWADPKDDIKAVCIGHAAPDLKEGDVVCAAFHAG